MNKKKKSVIPYILLFVLGLAILLYPTVSNWWNNRVARTLVNDYDSVIADLKADDIDQIKEEAEAYNSRLIGTIVPDAFAEEEANRPNKAYEELLDPTGSGYMGTVEIPTINVNLPIYHYTTETVLEKGVGHLAGSSLPIGGPSTHSVLSAHRGLPRAKLFTDLNLLEEGDVFFLHILNETLAYQVVLTKVVEPTDTSLLSVVEGEDYCTLFTCTPYGVNSHRLMVRGTRIPYTDTLYQNTLGATAAPKLSAVVIRILCVVAGLLLALVVLVVMRLLERKKRRAAVAKKKAEESQE